MAADRRRRTSAKRHDFPATLAYGPHLASRSAWRRTSRSALGHPGQGTGVHQRGYEGLRHTARSGDGRDPAIVADYRHAAAQAKAAGFDGVEVHTANNYLLEQFIRNSTNRRTDKYGGTIENRLRFPLDVVHAVVEVWDAKRVGIRISPATTEPGKVPLDSQVARTFGLFVDALSDIGLLYIHDIEGVTQQTRDVPDGVDFRELRKRFSGAYIANNQFTLDLAERTLADGDADLFSFGHPFLANPDLIERLRTGAPLADAPKEYWYGGGSVGYSDGPGMQKRLA